MEDFLMIDFIIRLSLGIVGLLVVTLGIIWCKVKKQKRNKAVAWSEKAKERTYSTV